MRTIIHEGARPLIRFAVRTTTIAAAPGWIWVVVHDSVEQLRRAATRYGGGDHSDTAACFQGTGARMRVDDDGRVTVPASRFAGVMRILPDHGAGTLAHEATHAALAIYGRQHRVFLEPFASDMADEEVLCYTVGDIVRGTTIQLLAKGVW